MYSGFWLYFWECALILAGAVFAGITVLVAVRGGAELLHMFRQPKPSRPAGVRKSKE